MDTSIVVNTLGIDPEHWFLAQNRIATTRGCYIFNDHDFRARLPGYIRLATRRTRCPACQAADFSELDYPAYFRPQERIFESVKKINQRLCLCSSCGLLFSQNVLSPDFCFDYLNHHYENSFFPINHQVPQAESLGMEKFKFYRRFLEDYAPAKNKKPRLLEISSYYGTGIAELADRYDVYGLEAENAAAVFSVVRYPQLRGRIINDVLENALSKLQDIGPFDVIIFGYSFRQVSNIEIVLKIIRNLVTDSGCIILGEGVWSNFIMAEPPEAAGAHYYQNKACYFNFENLSYALEANRFRWETCAFQGRSSKCPFDQSAAVFLADDSVIPDPERLARGRHLSDLVLQHFRHHAHPHR